MVVARSRITSRPSVFTRTQCRFERLWCGITTSQYSRRPTTVTSRTIGIGGSPFSGTSSAFIARGFASTCSIADHRSARQPESLRKILHRKPETDKTIMFASVFMRKAYTSLGLPSPIWHLGEKSPRRTSSRLRANDTRKILNCRARKGYRHDPSTGAHRDERPPSDRESLSSCARQSVRGPVPVSAGDDRRTRRLMARSSSGRRRFVESGRLRADPAPAVRLISTHGTEGRRGPRLARNSSVSYPLVLTNRQDPGPVGFVRDLPIGSLKASNRWSRRPGKFPPGER